MIGGDTAVTIPKLSRQNGVYKKTVATLDNQKNLQTKYRWLWMTKSNEETVWCVYARSAFWFSTIAVVRKTLCSKKFILHSIRQYAWMWKFTTVAAFVLWH